MSQNELYHFGVKGMKWGVRKKQYLPTSGVKGGLYAKPKKPVGAADGDELYAKPKKPLGARSSSVNKKSIPSHLKISEGDSLTTKKVKNDYNKMTDQEFMNKYSTSKKTYAKRVEKHGDPYTHAKSRNEKIQRNVERGGRVARKLVTTYMADKLLFGGAGTKVVKETVKQTGRAVVTAWVLANGGSDIRWYDN